MNNYSTKLKDLVEEFHLSMAYRASNYDDIRVVKQE